MSGFCLTLPKRTLAAPQKNCNFELNQHFVAYSSNGCFGGNLVDAPLLKRAALLETPITPA